MFTLDKSVCNVRDIEIASQSSKTDPWLALFNCFLNNDHLAARIVCLLLMVHTSCEWVVHTHKLSNILKNPHDVFFSTPTPILSYKVFKKTKKWDCDTQISLWQLHFTVPRFRWRIWKDPCQSHNSFKDTIVPFALETFGALSNRSDRFSAEYGEYVGSGLSISLLCTWFR